MILKAKLSTFLCFPHFDLNMGLAVLYRSSENHASCYVYHSNYFDVCKSNLLLC